MPQTFDRSNNSRRGGWTVSAISMTLVTVLVSIWATNDGTLPTEPNRPQPGTAPATARKTDPAPRGIDGDRDLESAASSDESGPRRPTDELDAIPPGRLLGRLVDGSGTPLEDLEASVIAWPSPLDKSQVLADLRGVPSEVREATVEADGSFRVLGLAAGTEWRVAVRGLGLLSTDTRPWVAFDPEDDKRPSHDLIVREVTAGRYTIEDPRRQPTGPRPFALTISGISFSTRGIAVLEPSGLAGYLAGVHDWNADRTPAWNEGFLFSSTGFGDPDGGFLGLAIALPGFRGAIQEVRVAGMRSSPVPHTKLKLGRPTVELRDLDWATDLPIRWPELGADSTPYWWLEVRPGGATPPDADRELSTLNGRPLQPSDLPGGTLHGIAHGPRRVRIRNRLGYDAWSGPIAVGSDNPAFAVARGERSYGEIQLSISPESERVVIRTPNGRQVRMTILGPDLVLPFAPVGDYAVLNESALEPLPLPPTRSSPEIFLVLENGPALGAWRDAIEFEVRVGARTIVELP
ncbi:MAG: hypothetical protein AAF196_03325 [Planctomycetota bacterium]